MDDRTVQQFSMNRADLDKYSINRPTFTRLDTHVRETLSMERTISLIFGVIVSVFVVFTVVSSCVFSLPPNPVNIYFAVCIIFVFIALVFLSWWYHRGEFPPKYRFFIYYYLFCIVMLCICANLYFHMAEL